MITDLSNYDYNKDELLKLLDVREVHSVYSIIGRMDALRTFFYDHPVFSGFNPFLTTYYLVTKKVSEKYLCDKDTFEDFGSLERLDVVFASKFFNAFEKLINGKEDLSPWHTFFKYCLKKDGNSFLQMFLGINAHINGDLAETLSEVQASSLHDFNKINSILLEVIPYAMKDLAVNYRSILGLGALLFLDFTKYEFEKTVVSWRSNAWNEYKLLLSDKKKIGGVLNTIHLNAERMGDELINAFSDNNLINTSKALSDINMSA